MKQILSVVAIVLALMVFTSCNGNKVQDKQVTKKSETDQVEHAVSGNDCKDVHWSHHEGADGPENWEHLCEGFSACGGSAQSPVDIVTKGLAQGDKLTAPAFNYGSSKVEIINNSHTVQFNVSGDNHVNLNGKDYKLLQFHYHALSEHTIDQNYFPLEVHFVHQHSDTDFAVLGGIYEEGEENELFKKYLDKFPTTKGEYSSEDLLDVLSLLPDNKSYYNYMGSLTTPPCSEVVSWYVLKTPLTASKEQIEKFSAILNNNYRPIMPLNDRAVGLYTE